MASAFRFTATGSAQVGGASVIVGAKARADAAVALSADVQTVDANGVVTSVIPLGAPAGVGDGVVFATEGIPVPRGGMIRVTFNDSGTGHVVIVYVR
jgi:hypothetical protein